MKNSHAFSLLELSIVLVIIGLIAGGIVAGSSMIRAAELRSVMTDITQYKTAIYTFRDKYIGLPGDLKNATAFWGEADADATTCKTTASTGTETCNGDGDGKISTHSTASPELAYEEFRFWQHLANAGLISGSFTGIAGSGSAFDADLGINTPTSKINGAGFSVYNIPNKSTTSGGAFAGKYGNLFIFAEETATSRIASANLSAEEAWNIDKKTDDGEPGLGNVKTGPNASYPNCSSTDDPNTAEYILTSDVQNACSLFINLGM